MKKLFCVLICFCFLLLTASCSDVSENEITSSTADDALLTELSSDRIDAYTYLSFSDPEKEDNAEPNDQKQNVDSFSLYKQYFYQNYNENDFVYLTDLTHDNVNDMLVFTYADETEYTNPEIHLFTISSGRQVKEIYSRSIHNFRTKIMLTSSEGISNMVVFEDAIFQGMGELNCSEFYFSESGEIIDVRNIYQKIDYGDNADEKYQKFDSEIKVFYSSNFSDIYLFPTGDNNKHEQVLDANPLIVFNGKPDWAYEEKTTEKRDMFDTWYCDIDLDGEMLTLILTFSEDGSVEYKYGVKYSELVEAYSGSWEIHNDNVILDMTGRSLYEEEAENVEIYEMCGTYHMTIENNNLILKHVEGKLLFNDLTENTGGKIFVFQPEELYS